MRSWPFGIYCRAMSFSLTTFPQLLPKTLRLLPWSLSTGVRMRRWLLEIISHNVCVNISLLHLCPTHSFADNGPHWRALCDQTSDSEVKHCQETSWNNVHSREGVGEETRCATCVLQWHSTLTLTGSLAVCSPLDIESTVSELPHVLEILDLWSIFQIHGMIL